MKGKIITGITIMSVSLVLMFSGCIKEPEIITTPIPTVTPFPALSPTLSPTPTPTPTPTRGSYQNPADISEKVMVKYLGQTYEITVLSVERGEKVWEELYAANMFNKEPTQGFEYLIAYIRFDYISGGTSKYCSEFDFNAYVEGVGYNPSFVVMPTTRPEFKTVNLMPGGKTEGWLYFEVPRDKPALIAYKCLLEPCCFIDVGS